MSNLVADLMHFEAFRAEAYPDPLSPLAKTGHGSGDPWTCGYGTCGSDVHQGVVWTREYAEQRLIDKIGDLGHGLDQMLPWWRRLSQNRQDALCNAAYQMGVGGLLDFTRALSALETGRFSIAAAEFLDSAWAQQTPRRAHWVAAVMATDQRPPLP